MRKFVEEKTIDIGGLRLAYTETGLPGSPTVVLLHGYLGSRRVWRHQIDALGRSRRVLALDWFGWGRSARDPRADYDYDTEVSRLDEALRALDARGAAVVGHDYGGFLALGLAVRFPGAAGRLGIVNSRACGTFTPVWKTVFGGLSLLCRTSAGRHVVQSLPLAVIHRRGLAPLIRAGVFDRDCLEDYVGWMETDPDGPAFFARFMSEYRVAVRPELVSGLASIRIPVAVVWGARDPYIPRSVPEALASGIPQAELTMIEAGGHFLPEHRPAEVTAAIERLLRSS